MSSQSPSPAPPPPPPPLQKPAKMWEMKKPDLVPLFSNFNISPPPKGTKKELYKQLQALYEEAGRGGSLGVSQNTDRRAIGLPAKKQDKGKKRAEPEPDSEDEATLDRRVAAAADDLFNVTSESFADADDGDADDKDDDAQLAAASAMSAARQGDEWDVEAAVDQLLRIQPSAGGAFNARQATIAAARAESSSTRRPQAQRAERRTVAYYAAWLREQLARPDRTIFDDILDDHAAMNYLQYLSRRNKLTRQGREIEGAEGVLSASALGKAYAMLNRVRAAQVAHAQRENVDLDRSRPYKTSDLKDLNIALQKQAHRHARLVQADDLTANSFLEYAAWDAERMAGLATGVVRLGKEAPSVLRTLLFTTMTCQTLHRMDDCLSLHISYLEPFTLKLGPGPGDSVASLVISQWEGKVLNKRAKVEPNYNFLIPHKDPRLCALGALAAWMYYLFDVVKIHEKPEYTGGAWSWANDASWRQVRLVPGQNSAVTSIAATTMYKAMQGVLDDLELVSRNKGHLGRKVGAQLMEANGASEFDITQTGHWTANVFQTTYATKVPRVGITTAAGYHASERMICPRQAVELPEDLLKGVFPQLEAWRAGPHTASAARFFDLMDFLRRQVIIHFASWYSLEPESVMLRTLPLFHGGDKNRYILFFRDIWPGLLAEAVEKTGFTREMLRDIHDKAVRDALGVLSYKFDGLSSMMNRRTAQFSPSKKRGGRDSHPTAEGSASGDTASGFHFLSTDSLSPSPSPSPASFHHPYPSTSRLPQLAERSTSPVSTAESTSRHLSSPLRGISGSRSAPLPPFTPSRPPNTPRRLHISPRLARDKTPPPSDYDFLVPPPHAYLHASAPTVGAAAPVFPHPLTWGGILAGVKQPNLLFERYGPKNASQDGTVRELWDHYSSGAFVTHTDGRKGQIPPIRELEQRFPAASGNGWTSKLNNASRQRIRLFRLVVRAIESRLSSGATLEEALDGIAAETGRSLSAVAKIAEFYKQTEGEGNKAKGVKKGGGRRKKEEAGGSASPGTGGNE